MESNAAALRSATNRHVACNDGVLRHRASDLLCLTHANELMTPSVSLQDHAAVHTSAGNACDFGYNNPQFSDKILHILPERVCDSNLPSNAVVQSSGPLLSMHINSLTLAANSDVFRFVCRTRGDWVDIVWLFRVLKLAVRRLSTTVAFLGHAEQTDRFYFTLEVD